MKAELGGGWVAYGSYGPETGLGRWLFAQLNRTGRRYPVALVSDGDIIEIEGQQAFGRFSNEEIARALLATEA